MIRIRRQKRLTEVNRDLSVYKVEWPGHNVYLDKMEVDAMHKKANRGKSFGGRKVQSRQILSELDE